MEWDGAVHTRFVSRAIGAPLFCHKGHGTTARVA